MCAVYMFHQSTYIYLFAKELYKDLKKTLECLLYGTFNGLSYIHSQHDLIFAYNQHNDF